MPHEVIKQEKYILVKLTGECLDMTEQEVGKRCIETLKAENQKYVVINLEDCSKIGPPVLRAFSAIYNEVKAVNGDIRLFGGNREIVNFIVKNGLNRVLINRANVREALQDLGLASAKQIDVKMINPFLSATMTVLDIQCQIKANPQKPYLKKPDDPLLLGDISGIISITSEDFCGTLAISFTEPVFCALVTNMLGTEINEIQEEYVDLVGEMANIILGDAKAQLSKIGLKIGMALPSCVWGKDHKIKYYGKGVCVVLPFETPAGVFYSEIMTNTDVLEMSAAA